MRLPIRVCFGLSPIENTYFTTDKLSVGDVPVLSTTLHPQSTVRNFGVILDSHLTMLNHISNVCRSGYYHLRQLRIKLIYSPVANTGCSQNADYTDQQLKRFQSVQNAAARLVTGARRSDHITPVLQSLHWQRIRYKIAMLVHKCLNGRAPRYLVDECRLAGGRRSGTRSAGRQMLEVTGCSLRHLATVHSLQRLYKSGTVYPTPCGTLLYVRTPLLNV